jgi:hypothetical protein
LLLRLRWARRLLFWGLLSALLRLPGTLLVALLSRCLLLPRRLLLGLGHALLLSRRCLLPVSLRLFPALLLFWFVVALRVSGYDQSGKQANCSGGRSTWELHFINSCASLMQARRVPCGQLNTLVHAMRWKHSANKSAQKRHVDTIKPNSASTCCPIQARGSGRNARENWRAISLSLHDHPRSLDAGPSYRSLRTMP